MRLKRAEYHLFRRVEFLTESDLKAFCEELEEYVQARIEEQAENTEASAFNSGWNSAVGDGDSEERSD